MLGPGGFKASMCLQAWSTTVQNFSKFDYLYPFDAPQYIQIGRVLYPVPLLVITDIMQLQKIIINVFHRK